MSHPALFTPFFNFPPYSISTLPCQSLLFPILDKHHQPWSGPASPLYLSPSSAPAPVPGTLSCPMAAVPWFSSLSPPAAISLPAPLPDFFSADRSGDSRDLSQHHNRAARPHKTRGEPQPLTHWHWSDAAPSPPSHWAVVWGQGEEVAASVCSRVSSMATNPTSWDSPNPP